MDPAAERQLAALVERYDLRAEVAVKLRRFAELLVEDPLAPTAIRDPLSVVDQHLADSLVALELEVVRNAHAALDLGSGPGAPGLPLAAALPETTWLLLESARRKCAFLERAASACGITNAEVVHARAESFGAGRGHHDLVTARAVARLAVTAEYAAPLMRVGGTFVAWAGKRDEHEESVAADAARELGLEGPRVLHVEPFPEAEHRHLYLVSKVRVTPSRFPRRPGVALRRPLGEVGKTPGGANSGRAPESSDRVPR
jgi:16S rRNA (guanine527-N7)-methyltransferase